jgi:spondin N
MARRVAQLDAFRHQALPGAAAADVQETGVSAIDEGQLFRTQEFVTLGSARGNKRRRGRVLFVKEGRIMNAPRRTAVRLVLGAALLSAACDDASPTAPRDPEPAPRASAAPVARYVVTFDATWSADTHPTDIPPDPHFSGLIGGTHHADTSFWRPGGLATEGIRLMAERGRQSPLDAEVMAAIAAGGAEHVLLGGEVRRSPGSTSLEFNISTGYPLVTLVTMVAPSPDWFVGVAGLSLLQDGDWVPERVVELFPYDAGTDSGTTYTSRDQVTAPPEPIQRLTGPPVAVGGNVPPMGRFTFRRLS